MPFLEPEHPLPDGWVTKVERHCFILMQAQHLDGEALKVAKRGRISYQNTETGETTSDRPRPPVVRVRQCVIGFSQQLQRIRSFAKAEALRDRPPQEGKLGVFACGGV